MQDAWVEFARHGRPGWAGWDGKRPVMRFDLPAPTLVHTTPDDDIRRWL